MMPKFSTLLPVYNERDNLIPLLDEIEAVFCALGEPFEVIAVDDASTDGSAGLLTEEARQRPYLKVILFRANAGQTAALHAGFRHAAGEIIVTMDADRQNDPRDIPGMLAMLGEGYDCVEGWRKDRKDGYLLRRLPSMAANALIRLLWKTKTQDLGCALKVYRREITEELSLYGEMHRFIGILLEGLGARVAVYPVNHRPRVAGRSKYNLTRVFKVLLDLTTIWFLQGFRAKPIYVFGGMTTFSLVLSAMAGGVAVFQKFFTGLSLNRNPLFTLSVSLVVIAMQFLVLGLLAELITRNHFESTNRSPYSIRRKIGFSTEESPRQAA